MTSLLLFAMTVAFGNPNLPHGGGFLPPSQQGCLEAVQRAQIKHMLAENRRMLQSRGALPVKRGQAPQPQFVWPLVQNPAYDDPGFWGISNYVDQDPVFPDHLLDYNGGARSYDTNSGYNHQGVDIFLWPFPWEMMARDQAFVVSGDAGTIIGKQDGNWDKNCVFLGGGVWNAVFIEHADGSVAWYGHLKTGSLTHKNVGDTVARGEFLGVVGSSGNSSGPHLHLEVYDADGNLNEPFEGPSNQMNAQSWWLNQKNYYQSKVLRIMTHGNDPVPFACPEDESLERKNQFRPGEVFYIGAYYRDQLQDQITRHQVIQPDGSFYWDFDHFSTAPHWAASWWYWWDVLPNDAPVGIWTYRTTFEGQVLEHQFSVGCLEDMYQELPAWPGSDMTDLVVLTGCPTTP